MKRKEMIRQLDLDLANYKGLLSPAEEQRYIELVAEGYDAADPEDGQDEEPLPLELVKLNKILLLRIHDASDAVNSFSIGGQSMWLTPEQRANYLLTIQAAKEHGVESVPFSGVTLPVDTALAALKAIDLYAMRCVGVTEAHEAAIRSLETAEEIEAYDITAGYPAKLNFDEEMSN